MCTSLEVEGLDLTEPLEERTDGKPLADIVTSTWLYEDFEKLRRWGLPPWTVEALRNVDSSAYGDGGDPPATVWQDPARLKGALQVLREWRSGLRSNPTVRRELDDHHMEDDWYDAQIMGIEDGISRCEWATARGKRVKLVVW